MNHEIHNKELFISWQGQVTGPYSLKDIQNLLKLGKIHSLYKVQAEGQWILLRDHLAVLEKKSREEAAKQLVIASQPQPSSTSAFKPVDLADDDVEPVEVSDPTHVPRLSNAGREASAPAGIAITSFVLSLFFFIPFLNGITWLLALIFGHLALANSENRPSGKAATLAWVGLWITYVEISYFLIGLAWSAATEVLPMMEIYFLLHALMLVNAIWALIGGGVLMLAVKLSSGHLIRFATCYVGALLPAAISALCMFFLQLTVASNSLSSGRSLLLIGLMHLVLFVGQIFFWARFIRLPDDEELGLSRATLASLLYTVVFIFVGLGYAAIFAVLISETQNLFP